jgi:TonB family protein
MKKFLPFLFIVLLTPCLIKPAYAQATAPAVSPQSSDLKLSVEMLSDAGGANNIDPYMKSLISDLKKHWLPLANQAANQPHLRQQETIIGITIAPDGHLLAMHLDDSTHNTALDKAAWGAIKEMTFLPPPPGMQDPNLKLRVHFLAD